MQPVGSAAKARYNLCYLWYLCDWVTGCRVCKPDKGEAQRFILDLRKICFLRLYVRFDSVERRAFASLSACARARLGRSTKIYFRFTKDLLPFSTLY